MPGNGLNHVADLRDNGLLLLDTVGPHFRQCFGRRFDGTIFQLINREVDNTLRRYPTHKSDGINPIQQTDENDGCQELWMRTQVAKNLCPLEENSGQRLQRRHFFRWVWNHRHADKAKQKKQDAEPANRPAGAGMNGYARNAEYCNDETQDDEAQDEQRNAGPHQVGRPLPLRFGLGHGWRWYLKTLI